ncbi:MAG: hypothetical protein JRF65_06385 [Deltaproteobacteria bacterium]|nr:hypothetical protein [Deltaproteobacteria bacterium]
MDFGLVIPACIWRPFGPELTAEWESRPPFRWVPAKIMRGRQEGGGSETLPFLGELVVVVVVVIEEIMQFGHEQLDIYRVSPEYAVEKVGRRTAITTTSTTTNTLVLATFAFLARKT